MSKHLSEADHYDTLPPGVRAEGDAPDAATRPARRRTGASATLYDPAVWLIVGGSTLGGFVGSLISAVVFH